MKKLAFAAVAALLILPVVASAQGAAKQGGRQGGATAGRPGGSPQDFQKRMAQRQKEMRDRMVKELKLSADQAKKLDALNKKTGDKRAKLFGTGRPDPSKMQAMRASMEKIQKEHEAELKKIFKPDQYAKYQKLVAEMRQRRRPGATGGTTRQGGGATKSGKG